LHALILKGHIFYVHLVKLRLFSRISNSIVLFGWNLKLIGLGNILLVIKSSLLLLLSQWIIHLSDIVIALIIILIKAWLLNTALNLHSSILGRVHLLLLIRELISTLII